MQEYKEIQKINETIYTLHHLVEFLDFDRDSGMPVGASEFRGKQLGLLETLINKEYKNPRLNDLFKICRNNNNLTKKQQIDVEETYKNWVHASAISEVLIEKMANSVAKTTQIWTDCKNKKASFKDILPHLQENFEITKQIANEKGKLLNLTPYNALCDGFQSGLTTEIIDKTFGELKTFLPDLIKKVKNKKTIPIKNYSKEQKIVYVKKLLNLMNFDWNRGRVGEVIHPCSCGMSPDTIVAINYNSDLLSLTYSVMHECGHCIYTQNLTDYLSAVGQQRGMGIHESQSLFYEKQIGKNENFVKTISKLMQESCGNNFELNEENILNTIRRVEPTFIRIDADEVTYPLHIVMRYEIEKAIINDELQVKDLPEVWNAKMKEYLGITPPNDLLGCLQDCHWYVGLIGYFPSYTFGAIIASQLMKKLSGEYNVVNALNGGDLGKITSFLNEKIHSKGCEKSFMELVKNATDNEIDVRCFKEYLEKRYLK
ncbi:MAG: carboxypeptidase M32 [Rickettsiales bacterium]|jgi:carboxypeptidase Taq|nr:carboxypeptidase M32 [Rickettsiales bacterium]